MFSLKTSTAKSLLLGTVLASALIAPLPALAQNICIMVLNTRSADGVYRNALRVVRGGQVFFFNTDDATAVNRLTADILRNKSLLTAWLIENGGLTAEEAEGACVEKPFSNPAPAKPDDEVIPDETGGEDPDDECTEGFWCGDVFYCQDKDIGMNDALLESLQFANLTVADLDDAQRMSAYATL